MIAASGPATAAWQNATVSAPAGEAPELLARDNGKVPVVLLAR